MEKCPICRMPAHVREHLKDGGFEFECLRCGPFSISADADAELRHHALADQSIAVASGYIRENAGLRIEQTDVARLSTLAVPNVAEKTGNILLQLAREFPTPSEGIANPAVMVGMALKRLKQFESASVFPAEIEHAPEVQWLKCWRPPLPATPANCAGLSMRRLRAAGTFARLTITSSFRVTRINI